ncbi:M90 family metallopeptidase [Pseudothauera rhizosphaerae]|uniref:Zinc-dependent peptidase n=1 Tax=Pseudothauera rhizosphaerae TaxID=2565932 RepID=A0A4S4AU83_9RHOO|nr:M90 family metallopeptidase [Pseudothauera rhizosphaerae]THF63497.1 zinc-dependent peptidase [Pseudothauera rhizosphaerae]
MLGWLRRLFGRGPQRPDVPEAQWRHVERYLPFLDFLPAAERRRLRGMALDFLRDKQFHGAHGLQVTDEMMLAIALQACLPVLNIGLAAYRGWVGIIVYPGDFVIPRSIQDEDGVVHEYDDEVLGEAWEGGPVLVSWFDGDDAPEGVNVVIHEFAHKLDMENGGVDGFPPLPATMSRKAWARAFNEAYERFCAQVDKGEDTVLDPYGAEEPGEFFAVAAETFFLDPHGLRAEFPAVYDQLAAYFRLDPANAGRAAASNR